MNMKKYILFILVSFSVLSVMAQDTETPKKENKNKSLLGYFILNDSKPLTTYEGGMVIDNQTSYIPSAKTLELLMQHRFGSMNNGLSDFLGIYGAANARMALNYSVTDWLQLGLGTTKNYKLQDLILKVNLLRQSRDKKSPVDVTFYGNYSVDARDESFFGEDYQFADRMAFFHELLVSRQVTKWFTVSAGGSFTHFNQVDSLYEHDKIALHFLGRFKFSSQSAIIVNCDLPLKIDGIKEWLEFTDPPKYNLGIGYEVVTATHVFQIFAGSATSLVPQYNVMLNQNDFFKGTDNIFIGFNISRVWNF
jgi:hypothetical protein